MVEAPRPGMESTFFRQSPEGGSLKVTHHPESLFEETFGHVLAVPTQHLPYLTFRDVFKSPGPELAEKLYDRWKDVPWKGDVDVHIGRSSLINELDRTFTMGSYAKGRPNVFARTLALPYTVGQWAGAELFRHNYYNPFTKAAYIKHPNLAFGMHEMGRAKFFDGTMRPWLEFGRIVPFVGTAFEYKGSEYAMKQFADDNERREALKILEPRFYRQIANDTLRAVFAGYWQTVELKTPMVHVSQEIYRSVFGNFTKQQVGLIQMATDAGGLAVGHLTSRYLHSDRKFGYVFEGKA